MDNRDVSLEVPVSRGAEAGSSLRRLLEDARGKLIQTGTRNRLVHCARSSKRGKFVDIVDEKSGEIFRILVRDGRRMRFLHNERAEEDEDADGETLEFYLDGESADDGRYTDLYLQTQLSEDKLQKRLLAMAREAKTLEEEQGVNALYLAIGFLRWFEDEKSQVPRHAPLILVPVDLKRNDLTSLYELVARPEDLVTNEPLKHRLNDDFGMRLPPIPDDEEWSPGSYFEAVAQAISGQSRWSIDIDGMQLGFFSFAKLLMVKDLEPESWPENGILDHPLLRGLLAEGFAGEPNDFPPGEKLDALFAPADLIQVVDADSSQTLVIEAVRKGRNLVVQGPPGTGKSQTITNIIAAAAHDGKTVLFMAEKMAALNVVHDRLKKAGLSALCLELHSRQANKKQVLEELSRTLGAPGAQAHDADDTDTLHALRDRLNSIASVMHVPMGGTGTTPFRVLSTLINLQEHGFIAPDLALPQSVGWSATTRETVTTAVRSLARISERTGPKLQHPLFGIGNTQILPMDHPRLAQAHLGRIPRGGMGAMGIVRSEIGKKRAHKPIRRLVAEAGAVIQQLKPVMLMSPISVAQYLKPGVVAFDLLVIDEASQIRPEDALGAVARARQIVVVGDTKQLPPTSFFDRMVSDVAEEEEDDDAEQAEPRATPATELESVLTLCEARGLGSRMLQWHYRSRHPSLIEVSNDAFYNGDLILFPSPAADREADGLMIRRVEGAYDRGGKRNNRIEAQAVVQAVARHAAHSPERSLGVVTFSTAQRDLITELLELARRQDDELDLFLREGRHEDVFVKNLENVQGDERDVILISVGYGPRIAGQRLDSMAFGPVSTEGGERRLNVLFTRARYRTEVFSSFASAEIDLNRSKSVGARILKRFLSFAETGISEQPQPLERDPDSDFEIAVASAIRSRGYTADYQVGSGGYRLDLAVRHPQDTGRYMLAIECDGATYHSSLWARERDRLRQEVLEGLGWQFHRIWSTDWFHRRKDEIRRLEEALLQASARPLLSGNSGSRLEDLVEDDVERATSSEPATVPPPELRFPAYVIADFPIRVTGEPHELSVGQLSGILAQVIDIEGPIHQDEIARRVAALFGKQRAGARMGRAVSAALRHLWTRDTYRNSGDFWMTAAQQQTPPIRDRSAAPPTIRKADMIPPLEIEAAALEVLRQNGAVARLDLPRAIALVLGFQRTGPEFSLNVLPVIDSMTDREILLEDGAGMIIASSKERHAK